MRFKSIYNLFEGRYYKFFKSELQRNVHFIVKRFSLIILEVLVNRLLFCEIQVDV